MRDQVLHGGALKVLAEIDHKIALDMEHTRTDILVHRTPIREAWEAHHKRTERMRKVRDALVGHMVTVLSLEPPPPLVITPLDPAKKLLQ